MRLYLDPEDLKPEHENITCDKVTFDHFNQQAQAVIRAAGRGVFQSWLKLDGYATIQPPHEDDVQELLESSSPDVLMVFHELAKIVEKESLDRGRVVTMITAYLG